MLCMIKNMCIYCIKKIFMFYIQYNYEIFQFGLLWFFFIFKMVILCFFFLIEIGMGRVLGCNVVNVLKLLVFVIVFGLFSLEFKRFQIYEKILVYINYFNILVLMKQNLEMSYLIKNGKLFKKEM